MISTQQEKIQKQNEVILKMRAEVEEKQRVMEMDKCGILGFNGQI